MSNIRRHLMVVQKREPLRPTECGRVGRLLLAGVDDDRDKTESVIQEAATAGELPDLALALSSVLTACFRSIHDNDLEAMRSNAYSLIAEAQMDVRCR
jgi:hypothetical protein